MLYVGLTKKHRESASLFANVVGSQVLSQADPSNATVTTKNSRSVSESGSDKSNIQNSTTEVASNVKEAKSGNMTVKTLMEVYEGCITHLRKTQGTRRVNSLKRISPANFTKKARTRVPDKVIQQIKSLNNLDVELYKYAKEIFAREHELVVSKKLPSNRSFVDLPNELRSVIGEMGNEKVWQFVPVALMLLMLFLFFLFVNARRIRTSKVKI